MKIGIIQQANTPDIQDNISLTIENSRVSYARCRAYRNAGVA